MPPVWGIWSIAASTASTLGLRTKLRCRPQPKQKTLDPEQSPATGHRKPGHAAYRKRLPCPLDRSSAIGATTYSVRMSWETLIHPENAGLTPFSPYDFSCFPLDGSRNSRLGFEQVTASGW